MEFDQLVGFAGAFCTTLSFLPQVITAIKSKDLSSISLGMYCLFTLGITLWLGYSFILGDKVMITANIITLLLCSIILYCKIRFEMAKSKSN